MQSDGASAGGRPCLSHGWLSKVWSLYFGSPKYWVPHYIKDPKRDHNFDNHPHVLALASCCPEVVQFLECPKFQ